MRKSVIFALVLLLALALFVVDVAVGNLRLTLPQIAGAMFNNDVDPTIRTIVVDIRLVKAVVAVIVGIALSISGLQMQTMFRNPLAGPYVLGISSGASMGVALVVLCGFATSFGIVTAAWIGAAAVLTVVWLVARRIRDIMSVLVLGMMFSSGVGAVVQIMQYLSREDALKTFVVWTMGSLGDVSSSQLPVMFAGVLAGLLLAVATVKHLNILLLGEDYAVSLGLDLRRSRTLVFISTTLLAGTVTAFCGPVGFIGLAMPHVARAVFRVADHRVLLPASALTGAAVMLLCDIISKIFIIPLNSVTSLLGIPIVVWIVWRNRL